MEVDDIEALQPRQLRQQRRVADREARLDPVDEDVACVGRGSLRRGGEDLDLVSALSLADGDPEGGVAGTARVGRKGRGEVSNPQGGPPALSRIRR